MSILKHTLSALLVVLVLLLPGIVGAADIDRFAGTYVGEAEFAFEGQTLHRDMSTTITPNKAGFTVSWTSVSHLANGDTKSKTYSIEFVPSKRDRIYGSAMKTNMFGKQTPLDPMQGEPFVWSRLEGDTFSVFSLFINVEGDYEMQEYHRTLVPGGLDLLFRRVSNGIPQKEINAFLERQG